MTMLRDQLVRQGNTLFRWRTYVPLVVLPMLFVALHHAGALEQVAGERVDFYWKLLCLLIAGVGIAVRCVVGGFVPGGTSGRNTEEQLAASLNATGMYSVVRHPLYLGNFLCMLGVVLALEVWWFAVICCLAFWLYYERIILAEEEFLRQQFGEEFEGWASVTPAFIPRPGRWRAPTLRFSWKTMLRREFSGACLLAASFILVKVLGDGLGKHEWRLDLSTIIVFLAGLCAYLTLAILKRKTRLLHVEGR